MVLFPLACPAIYVECKACFFNAALIRGFLSINLPLQNRSRGHALVVTEFNLQSYKMTVNLSNVNTAALTSSKLGWLLKEAKYRVTSL